MSEHDIVRQTIEALYGPCPVEDFERANQWAEEIDWEVVRDAVEERNPGFAWSDPKTDISAPAEVVVFEVRSAMLEDAGRASLE